MLNPTPLPRKRRPTLTANDKRIVRDMERFDGIIWWMDTRAMTRQLPTLCYGKISRQMRERTFNRLVEARVIVATNSRAGGDRYRAVAKLDEAIAAVKTKTNEMKGA